MFVHFIDYETFSSTFTGWKYDIVSQWKELTCQEAYPQKAILQALRN
jgi:hypothetical protein